MKSLKKYIKEEITRLSERQFPIPPKILDILKNKLKMDPLIRYVENLKAVNSIPPSYRVFLINGEYFDLIDENFSLLVKIGSKEYFLNDIDEKNYAIKHINRLLIGSKIKPENEEDEEDGEDSGGDIPDLPPPPELPSKEPEV